MTPYVDALKKFGPVLLLVFVPLGLGLFAFVLMRVFLGPIPPFIYTADVGVVGIVFGATLRDPGVVAFIAVTALAFIIMLFYLRNQQQTEIVHQTLEDAVREAEQRRRHFLRRLDHEIKNPLTALQAALVNLRESEGVEERQRAAHNAERSVARLTRLLADLRKLSDLEERPLERLTVEIPEMLEDVVGAVRALPAFEKRTVNLLISRVPWPFPTITGDRDLLALVMYNLIENALKFTSREEAVEVRALEDGRAIVIEVADSGPGIPPDELPKIFEELYRGANARGIEGSGLGLALVQRIINLHGGQISVRSRQDDPRGTVFSLRLPVKK
jgi:two-component system, OmpR family, sensor kinase